VVSQPQAVNARGQIVGNSSQTPDFTAKRAFLWERGGPMLDLNALVISNSGVQLVNAFDINSRGEISAIGVLPNGDSHAIMLMPCDEDTLALRAAISEGGRERRNVGRTSHARSA
jgi:probable HAF family extracellular repeat protein